MNPLTRRKKIRLSSDVYRQGHTFSVTIATHQRYPWFNIFPDLAETLTNIIVQSAQKRSSDIFTWCIMPDHLHLLVQDPNLPELIRLIKGPLAAAAKKVLPARKLWQRSYYDHALRSEEALEKIAGYIWHNPVRKGLVMHATDYPWSGSLVWPDWRQRVDKR